MKAPVYFIGHGSPMNALEQNEFTQSLNQMRALYPNPKAILCISAHWMTEGSWVTAMPKPKTIHDFYGFPEPLFQVQYPAPGDPTLAKLICDQVSCVHPDFDAWGLDHGTWSVVRHIFPNADVPVLQLSLHMEKPPEYHFELGQKLRFLREQGVLLIGSGNVVHNLRKLNWTTDAAPFDWALEYDAWIKEKLVARDFKSLTFNFRDSESGKLSVPTLEHYLPLLYTVGASDESDQLEFLFEGIQNASISMRTMSFASAKSP
jgi:4,5-DOPA dioxygenase extradiol